MRNLDSPDRSKDYPSAALLLDFESRRADILAATDKLIADNKLEDKAEDGENSDLKRVTRAAEFIKNPTDNLADIMEHGTNVGEVIVGYEMQGADTPDAVGAMHAYLFALQGINLMRFVEMELEKGVTDSPEIKSAMTRANSCAVILAKGYKNTALSEALTELRKRLK